MIGMHGTSRCRAYSVEQIEFRCVLVRGHHERSSAEVLQGCTRIAASSRSSSRLPALPSVPGTPVLVLALRGSTTQPCSPAPRQPGVLLRPSAAHGRRGTAASSAGGAGAAELFCSPAPPLAWLGRSLDGTSLDAGLGFLQQGRCTVVVKQRSALRELPMRRGHKLTGGWAGWQAGNCRSWQGLIRPKAHVQLPLGHTVVTYAQLCAQPLPYSRQAL